MSNKYAWSRNSDDEIWRGGPCDSIRECVKEAVDEGYGVDETIALGLIEPYEIDYDFANFILERLGEDAYDEVGEVSYGWLDSVSKEAIEKLNSRLTEVVSGWLKEVHEEPTFYKVIPCEECTLTEAMNIHYERVKNAPKGGKTGAIQG
jgi:hypothetical protein